MKINLKQTAQEALDSTSRKKYVNKDVLKNAPLHNNENLKGSLYGITIYTTSNVEVEFFKLYRYVSDEELEKEYSSRGLIPADIREIASVSKDILDEKKGVGTHWKDSSNKWCFAAFGLWDGGRRVVVGRGDDVWDDGWWFAGVRKSLENSTSELIEPQSLSLEFALKMVIDAGYVVTKISSPHSVGVVSNKRKKNI